MFRIADCNAATLRRRTRL